MELGSSFFGISVIGLELFLDPDGNYLWSFANVKKEKNKIQILKSAAGIADLKQLTPLLDAKLPVLLSINGKGIIHKKITSSQEDSYESMLIKVLPSGKIEDFYVQQYGLDNANSIVSIARRSLLDEILLTLKNSGVNLVECTFGPFAFQSFAPLLNQQETSQNIAFGSHELLISQGAIKAYAVLKEPVGTDKLLKIGGLDIEENVVIAFSSGFAYFNPISQIISNLTTLAEPKQEHKNELRFKKVGVVLLISTLLILLINFLIFGYLSDQIKSKSVRFILSSSKLALADSLAKQVDERTSFLAKSGLSQASRTSFYADQIAETVPESIILTSMNIEPLIKNDDDKKKMQFEAKKILITGKSRYALDVNEWIKLLRTKNWVNSISLSNYKQNQNSDLGEFALEIKMK